MPVKEEQPTVKQEEPNACKPETDCSMSNTQAYPSFGGVVCVLPCAHKRHTSNPKTSQKTFIPCASHRKYARYLSKTFIDFVARTNDSQRFFPNSLTHFHFLSCSQTAAPIPVVFTNQQGTLKEVSCRSNLSGTRSEVGNRTVG